MRFLYRFAADFIWIVHFFVVVIVLFGWLVPSFWFVYIAVVTGALISELLLNYCFFSIDYFNKFLKIRIFVIINRNEYNAVIVLLQKSQNVQINFHVLPHLSKFVFSEEMNNCVFIYYFFN